MARAVITLVTLWALAMGARADSTPVTERNAQAIDAQLVRGKQLFEDQEYAPAIQTLVPITRDARATRAQRLRALELIALAQFIRRDEAAARATFERILDIDPGYQLHDTSGSPKIRAFFEQLKQRLVPGYDPTAGADLEHAAPASGTAGRAIELEVRATRGADRVFEITIATRRRGELAYRIASAAPRGEAQWRARVTPERSAKPYVLEYYLEARDAGGGVIGRIASPDAPLELGLAGGMGGDARPWYGRWYVIAGAAAVAASATGLIFMTTRGPDAGTLPPGSVTITP